MKPDAETYDYVVVGSGFGGAVSALRLAEKGWRVAVVEQGRRIGPQEITRAKQRVWHLLWLPQVGLRGYFAQHVFRHLVALGGVGVGGGSLVWGAVMLEPKQAFYDDPALADLGIDWREELAPYFTVAKGMLGVRGNPRQTEQDRLLRATARRMGVEETFASVPNAIFFGDGQAACDDVGITDPYFDGHGPHRAACRFCGGCLTGCEFGSKNSLDYNYLYLAQQHGAVIMAGRRAGRIVPLPTGGYTVTLTSGRGRVAQTLATRNLVLSAGVVGTIELLLRNRDHYRTLPAISPTLGRLVRTNSEAITAVMHPPGSDMSDGTAISTDFHPDPHTHATQNRFDRGYRFMRMYMGPLVDDARPAVRSLKTLLAIVSNPRLLLTNLFAREWEKRLTVFTVMQDVENHLSLKLKTAWWSFFRPVLTSASAAGKSPPSYLPVANRVAREFAKECGGTPMNTLVESLLGKSTTAHILSGCPMGEHPGISVIDTRHEVHGYRGFTWWMGRAFRPMWVLIPVSPSRQWRSVSPTCNRQTTVTKRR
ncbi:MAG: FAD-dependent oxidoreductase [Halioglobus sp.]